MEGLESPWKWLFVDLFVGLFVKVGFWFVLKWAWWGCCSTQGRAVLPLRGSPLPLSPAHPHPATAGMQNSCLPGCAKGTSVHSVSWGMFWGSQGVKLLAPVGLVFLGISGTLGQLSAVLPYLSGVLRSFANKQAYKVRFIALDFLLGNWSPFNVGPALWTLCQWLTWAGCVYMHVCGLHLVLLFQAAPGSGTV